MKIMRRIVMLSTLALGLSGGAAFAERWHGASGNGYHARAGGYQRPVVVEHGYRGGGYVRGGGGYVRGGGYYHGGGYYRGGYVREPIYMRAPVMRERYYNYYRRPALVVEDFGPREGYLWVRGSWQWDGGEWIWQPGHYQPAY